MPFHSSVSFFVPYLPSVQTSPPPPTLARCATGDDQLLAVAAVDAVLAVDDEPDLVGEADVLGDHLGQVGAVTLVLVVARQRRVVVNDQVRSALTNIPQCRGFVCNYRAQHAAIVAGVSTCWNATRSLCRF